jgi:CheY-like chemotaxis protein
MLVNLALNARDAMPDGGDLRIEAEAVEVDAVSEEGLEPGAYVCLRVVDQGHGMPPEVSSHVFEPFFTTKAKGQGTGLGLATAYGAVSEAGGSITVSSAVGEGTTFVIHLPVAQPVLDSEPLPAPAATAGDQGVVLLVEDDAAVRRVAGRILRGGGYDIVEADCGAVALEALERLDGNVSLVLTDLVMPYASGWDLAEQVAQRWPGTPTVFMSGYTDNVAQRDELVAQGLPFLAKPFTADALLAEVAAHTRPAARGA